MLAENEIQLMSVVVNRHNVMFYSAIECHLHNLHPLMSWLIFYLMRLLNRVRRIDPVLTQVVWLSL